MALSTIKVHGWDCARSGHCRGQCPYPAAPTFCSRCGLIGTSGQHREAAPVNRRPEAPVHRRLAVPRRPAAPVRLLQVFHVLRAQVHHGGPTPCGVAEEAGREPSPSRERPHHRPQGGRKKLSFVWLLLFGVGINKKEEVTLLLFYRRKGGT